VKIKERLWKRQESDWFRVQLLNGKDMLAARSEEKPDSARRTFSTREEPQDFDRLSKMEGRREIAALLPKYKESLDGGKVLADAAYGSQR